MREAEIQLSIIYFTSNRTYGGDGEIKILAEDIDRNGLINPITIKESPEKAGKYEVVAGRRRVMAVYLLGWDSIPCRILEGNETERSDEIAGAENINRLAMHPLDEAKIFHQLLESGRSIEDLAKQYDRKVSEIWQRIQLLDLNEDVKTLFRNGHLTLQSAAMIKCLNADAQKEFYKKFKSHRAVKEGGIIEDCFVKSFISNLDHDKLYGFLRDKQCADCKTRTYFTDTNLFPELNDVSENCFNHECYLQKWQKVLAGRFKSLTGEHKTHAGACLIVANSNDFQKIIGNQTTIEGTGYKVLPYNHFSNANAKDKGAQPCFTVGISHSGKLEIACDYWKAAEKQAYGSGMSNTEKKKKLTPVVEILDLPKTEKDEALEAMSNSKRISPYGLSSNVRDSVFWRIVDIKAQEFNDPNDVNHSYKEMFLKKYFSNLHGSDKKIFEKFVGDMAIPDLAKIVSDKIFALLLAMEWSIYELPQPEDFSKGKQCEILKWAGLGLAPDKLKEIYQDEIRRRIPKQKPEKEKPEGEKQEKTKTPVAKKTAEKKSEKKNKPLPTPEQMKKNKAKADKAKK